MGRKSTYTPAIAAEICRRIAAGESMRMVCADKTMPPRDTVLGWLRDNEDFQSKCARAREDQAEFHHDEMEDIERRTLSGELDSRAANVVLSNKRWRMEKLKPKVYGARIDHNHTGKLTLESLVTGATENDSE